VQVKKKVKEKKGRSERPRIDKGREAIPSGVNFVVDGVDHIKPSVQIGAVSVGQIGVLGGGVAGRELMRFMRERMKLFSVRSTFFSDFFQIFFQSVEHFAHRGTFSWNIFFCVEHFFFLTRAWRGAGPGPES